MAIFSKISCDMQETHYKIESDDEQDKYDLVLALNLATKLKKG